MHVNGVGGEAWGHAVMVHMAGMQARPGHGRWGQKAAHGAVNVTKRHRWEEVAEPGGRTRMHGDRREVKRQGAGRDKC